MNRLSYLGVALCLFVAARSTVMAGRMFQGGRWWYAAFFALASCALVHVIWRLLKIAWTSRARALMEGGGGSSGSSGLSGAGKPAPLKPAPTHHLAAAKEWPPSDETHSFPKD